MAIYACDARPGWLTYELERQIEGHRHKGHTTRFTAKEMDLPIEWVRKVYEFHQHRAVCTNQNAMFFGEEIYEEGRHCDECGGKSLAFIDGMCRVCWMKRYVYAGHEEHDE